LCDAKQKGVPMKVAVMGAGALGGFFGGKMAASGEEVWLIARGAHLEAMKRDGLRILSPNGDLHVTDIGVTDDPAEVGPVDVVLFMVKNVDVEGAAEAIKPMLGPDTFVVTCQNGITAWERLGAVIGADRVVPGVARTPGEITEPGVVTHTAPLDILVFGEVDGTMSARCKRLADAMIKSGTTPQMTDSILDELWSKFCGQSTLASLTTLTGLDIGPLRENEVSAKLFQDAIEEVVQVGKAAYPQLRDGILEHDWDFVMRLPPTMHASMLDDRRRGKPLEHEYLSGDVVRLGKKYGVPTPIHSVLYAALKPISDQLA
jgi:2-dehydropantoate 2-reductase